jgi:hypothetical protein
VSPFHQSSKNPRIGRTAANEAMRAELEYVADHSDRSRGAGLERATLQLLGSIAENDVIDFGRRKPSDLNRRPAGSILQTQSSARPDPTALSPPGD